MMWRCVLCVGTIVAHAGAFYQPCWQARCVTSSALYDRRLGEEDFGWQQQQRRSDDDDYDESRRRFRGRANGGDSSQIPSRPRGRGDPQRRSPRGRRDQLLTEEPAAPKLHSYYLATCLPGMAEILQDELLSIGCVAVEPSGKSAVNFGVTDIQTILRVLLWTRTAHKVMELLVSSTRERLFTREDVYNYIRDTVPVSDLLGSPDKNDWLTLAVSVTLNNAKYIPVDINHSHYTALTVKNALVDAARAESDSRPSVDTTDPDVPLVAVLRGIPSETRYYSGNSRTGGHDNINDSQSAGAQLSLYRQIHAGSLHRRGYRYGTAIHKAALKESTAAGLLMAAGWSAAAKNNNETNAAVVLVDPMMGSGTFLLEGAMMAADLAPGLMRLKCGVPASLNPPILRWRNHHHVTANDAVSKQELDIIWNDLLRDATTRAKEGMQRLKSGSSGIKIVGNDIHPGAVDLAAHALRLAGLSQVVQLHQGDCLDWQTTTTTGLDMASCPSPQWMVVSNPPWGVRLTDDMHESWESLRIFLRERCPPGNTEAWILSGSREATKHLGLRRSQSLPLQTGQQNLRWLQYIIRDKSEAITNSAHLQSQKPSSDLPKNESPPNQGRDGPRVVPSTRPKKKSPQSEQIENEWLI